MLRRKREEVWSKEKKTKKCRCELEKRREGRGEKRGRKVAKKEDQCRGNRRTERGQVLTFLIRSKVPAY